MNKRFNKIVYVIKHRRAFRLTEKKLLGVNTLSGLTHDLGKLLMLLFFPFLSVKKIGEIHKKTARHHNPVTPMDYIQKVIDYECAHYTKADKQLTARQYIEQTKQRRSLEENEILETTLKLLHL